MTDPAERPSRPHAFDDPTRDIRLPSPPGSPPMTVRPEWSSFMAPAAPPAAPAAAPAAPATEHAVGPPTWAQSLASEPTDELVPPGGLPRQPTLKFEQGAAAGGNGPAAAGTAASSPPAGPIAAPVQARNEGGRRWPWVLMALLPIIVIVGSGIWLFILLSHA